MRTFGTVVVQPESTDSRSRWLILFSSEADIRANRRNTASSLIRARGEPDTLADFVGHDAIACPNAERPWRWRPVERAFRPPIAQLRVDAESGEAVLSAAALGLNIADLLVFPAERALAEGQAVPDL